MSYEKLIRRPYTKFVGVKRYAQIDEVPRGGEVILNSQIRRGDNTYKLSWIKKLVALEFFSEGSVTVKEAGGLLPQSLPE